MGVERTTVRLDEHLLAKVRDLARSSGRTVTSLIEEGLQRVLGARSKPAPKLNIRPYGGGWYREGIDPKTLPSDLLKQMDEQEDARKLGLPWNDPARR